MRVNLTSQNTHAAL